MRVRGKFEPRSVSVVVSAAPHERGLAVSAVPADPSQTLRANHATVVLTVWREGPDAVRGTLSHWPSGTVAYFQATDGLLRIAEALELEIEPAAP